MRSYKNTVEMSPVGKRAKMIYERKCLEALEVTTGEL